MSNDQALDELVILIGKLKKAYILRKNEPTRIHYEEFKSLLKQLDELNHSRRLPFSLFSKIDKLYHKYYRFNEMKEIIDDKRK